jgi:hypothetical protein
MHESHRYASTVSGSGGRSWLRSVSRYNVPSQSTHGIACGGLDRLSGGMVIGLN